MYIKANEPIERNFNHHATKEGDIESYTALRESAKEFAYLIDALVPNGREKSLAMTKLEESLLWAITAIAKD